MLRTPFKPGVEWVVEWVLEDVGMSDEHMDSCLVPFELLRQISFSLNGSNSRINGRQSHPFERYLFILFNWAKSWDDLGTVHSIGHLDMNYKEN